MRKWMMKIVLFQEDNFSFVMMPLEINLSFLLHDESLDLHWRDDSIKPHSQTNIHDAKDM